MQKSALLWTGILLFLVLMLLTIIFPKTVYKELDDNMVKTCECYGSEFWFGTKCVGFPTNCNVSETPSWNKSCEEPTCTEIFDKLYEKNRILSQQLKAKAGTDVILIIDSSNSMEGAKLLAAKQAAQRLVSNLQEGERIGVVSFSENSSVIHKFSDDQGSLTEGIMSISISGGTNYLPALHTAEQLFAKQQRSAKRGIIFLSDGVPSDDRESILYETDKLREEGVSLFTISFGIIKRGNETNILEEMVSDKNDPDVLKRWYREFTDSESITEAFSQAWQEISNLDIITITPTFDEQSFSTSELPLQGFWVMLDTLFLTEGVEEDALCVPQMIVEGVANGTNGSKKFSLLANGHKYFFPEDTLSPDTYNVTITAGLHSNHNGTCVFSGELPLGELVVEDESDRCRELACEEVREVLEDFDLAAREGATLPRETGFGRVAILMDSSESMRGEQREVLRGVDRLNRLLSLGDERALITFSDVSRLVVPLTHDKDEFTEALGDVFPHGTTLLVPALVKAGFLFQEGSKGDDVVVVVTDGVIHDAQGAQGIRSEAESLVDEGTCLFVIGYGSELLREKEQISLFKEMSDYSTRKLGCGGYAYTPDSDHLSSLVTNMFGGERRDNESLRIIIERSKGSDAGSMSIVARAVSMQTGLPLPLHSHNLCIPAPTIDIALHRKNGEEIAMAVQSFPDGSVRANSPYLFPGRYVLQADASMPIDGCEMKQSYVEEFIIIGPPTDSSESIVTIIILLLAVSIVFLMITIRKKWRY